MVYAFKRRFKLSKKVAIQEYKAFGYKVTPEQSAFMKKKETVIKLQKQKRKEAKRERAFTQEMEEYKQNVINNFLETQEIADIETWLILKDEFF